MKRALQSRSARAQVAHGHSHGADLALEDALLTTAEAAAFVRFEGPRAVDNFHAWTHRHKVPRLYRGRIPLWRKGVLLAFLERRPWTRDRHASQSARLRLAGQGKDGFR